MTEATWTTEERAAAIEAIVPLFIGVDYGPEAAEVIDALDGVLVGRSEVERREQWRALAETSIDERDAARFEVERLEGIIDVMQAGDADNAELRREIARLRAALVTWDFGSLVGTRQEKIQGELRDQVVEYLIARFDPDRPYPAVDHVIDMVTERSAVADQILFGVIPEDRWGLDAGAAAALAEGDGSGTAGGAT